MVVTAGVQFLRDGMRVRLPGERPRRAGKPISRTPVAKLTPRPQTA